MVDARAHREQYLQEIGSWWSGQVRAQRLAVRNSYPEPEQWVGFFMSP
jgi:hypothetical protein